MSPQGRNSQGPEPTVLVTEPSLGERVWGTKLCLEAPRKPRDFECPSLVTCAVCEAGSVCPTGHSQPCPCPASSPCSSSKHAHSPCCTLPHLSGMSTFLALLLLPAHDGVWGGAGGSRAASCGYTHTLVDTNANGTIIQNERSC